MNKEPSVAIFSLCKCSMFREIENDFAANVFFNLILNIEHC